MKSKAIELPVSKQIGSVSAELIAPDTMDGILVLAHGAGAGMQHPFMSRLAQELGERNIATLRFNFPFIENGKKRPDFPAVAEKTIEAAIIKAHELFPKSPVFAGGKSFGGRMSSHYASKNPELIKGLIYFGFPLHQPGTPSTDRADHLGSIKLPMLFLQGTRDALAQWDLIEKVSSTLPTSKLVKIDGADHSFKAGKTDTMLLLADASATFIRDLL